MEREDITNLIKNGSIPGPQSIKFKKAYWKELLNSNFTDIENNLVACGLFFDRLLEDIRLKSNIKNFTVDKDTLVQIAIAVTTLNVNNLKNEIEDNFVQNETGFANFVDLLSPKITALGGSKFSLDELATSFGDSLNLMLKQVFKINLNENNLIEIGVDQLAKDIAEELVTASAYLTFEEYWLRCAHFDYHYTYTDVGQLRFSSRDAATEEKRVISTFRHRKLLFESIHITSLFWNRLSRKQKEKIAGQAFVTKVSGQGIIDNIEVGFSNKSFKCSMISVWSRILIESSFYFPYLKQPQEMFNGLNYIQLIKGWCFLQSLSAMMNCKTQAVISDPSLTKLKTISPLISKKVLISALANSINSNYDVAKNIINALTFNGDFSQDLWSQPVLNLESGFCLATPCIQASHLERILENWMRQSSFDFAIKGPEFENFCRQQLNIEIQHSELKGKVKVLDESLIWKHGGITEEIDIVIVFNKSVVLLVEAKCVLWPDSALQFSNYQKQVEFGINQIDRKKKWVEKNKEDFLVFLRKQGNDISDSFNIEACVLTNSAILSGFPEKGIAVVDLTILKNFFTNHHSQIAQISNGTIRDIVTQQFYNEIDSIGESLMSYLHRPPQLETLRKSIQKREVKLPCFINDMPVIFETTEVNIDTENIINSLLDT